MVLGHSALHGATAEVEVVRCLDLKGGGDDVVNKL